MVTAHRKENCKWVRKTLRKGGNSRVSREEKAPTRESVHGQV